MANAVESTSLEEFVRSCSSAILLLDKTGSIIYANSLAETLFRRPFPDLVGLPFTTLLAPTGIGNTLECIAEALSTAKAVSQLEARLDGGLRPGGAISFSLTHLRTEGGQRSFLVIADDITARKDIEEKILESRNKFRAAIDAATDWILFVDPQFRIIAANKAFAMHVGQSVREMWGKRCDDFCPSEVRQHCAMPTVFSTGRSCQREMLFHSAVYGSDRLLAVTASPYVDDDGRITAVVEVMRDITEETRWQEAHDEMKRLNRLKDEFLASVSHELRTPLTAIRTMIELLLANPDEDVDVRSEFLGIVQQQTERLSRLINNILDLSRIRAGKAQWSFREFDLRSIITGVFRLFASEAKERGVAFVVQLPEQEVRLIADRDRIEQVVSNLVSNALKFTERGGKITIAVEYPSSQSALRKFSVADTGVGIAAENLQSVFDQFTQVGNTASGKPSGTGLGLPICKHIVERHGGRIWAESEPGKGSGFFVELPAEPPALSGEFDDSE